MAELTGPGAVTQIWQSQPAASWPFISTPDGSRPSTAGPTNWPKTFLPFFEQKEPVVTCLPYAKSLKIVFAKAERADYRIEYVTSLLTCRSKRSNPTAGAAHAAGWRQSTIVATNTAGEPTAKPIPSHASPAKSNRGTRPNGRPRLSAGKGIVQWLKLQTGVALLAKDDLWLEVLVDGEAEPAIAAPARYFFPSLVGGDNHDNFLAVFREGFTSMLAMPFATADHPRYATPAESRLERDRCHVVGDRRRSRAGPIRICKLIAACDYAAVFIRRPTPGPGSIIKVAAAWSAWWRNCPRRVRWD